MSQSPQQPTQNPAPPNRPRLVLRRTDQATVAVMLTVALVLLAGHWGYQTWRHGQLIEIDRAEPIDVAFQIDVNSADWAEFCLLPGVGEVLAKRIVEYRREHGPFRDLTSLREVRGIGPKTFERMQPYLMPLPDVEATAGESLRASDGPG